MQKTPYLCCCNLKFVAREYYLEPKNKMKRCLYFADECPNCKSAIAEIVEFDFEGYSKTTLRRHGASALALLNKYKNLNILHFKMQTGNCANEYLYFQNMGNIYNLNGRFISTHKDFLNNNT